jgi:polysaccharide biosynthesis transport protein
MNELFGPPTRPGQGPAVASPSGVPARSSFSLADLKQYFHIVVKRIWLVALCFVISLTFTVVMLVRQVPVYSCRATLMLSRGIPVTGKVELEPLGEYIDTQQLIINSPLLVSRAKERLNRPAEDLGKILGISVFPLGKTAFIAIQVDSLDSVLGADMANALAEEYLDFKSEERMDTSQATVISLTQQANRLHEELKKADERAMTYVRENNVVGIQERGNVAATYLASLSSREAEYRTERMFLEAQQPLLAQASDEAVLTALAPSPNRLSGVRQLSISDLGGGGTNKVSTAATQGGEELVEYGVVVQSGWESLKRQKALLDARLLEYRKRFHDAHPLVQETLKALEDVQQNLNVELQFALRQYYSRLESLSIKEQASKRVEKEWEEQAIDVTKKGQEYKSIMRNTERLQNLYDLVLNRIKDIDISAGIEVDSVRIMERAKPSSSPITPRKLQSIFMAALIGLGIGLALVFGLEYIDDSFRFPEEITQVLGLPFFGLVPAANWDPDDLRSHVLANVDQKSGLAEAYRNIRSSLLFSASKDRVRVLAVTSAVPKEGKTTTCLNLAVSLAQAGSRILLVDGDLRRGELHKFFGLEGGRGFSDILIGQAKPEAVIQRTGIPNLDMVATGPFPPNPAEIVLRPELQSFIEYAKRTYDRIIIDCPPVMAVSEAGILASMAEGVVVVIWAGQTSKKLALLAVQQLRERGAKIMGCVLNNLDFQRVGYYYYSTYYGYYDYDDRYAKKGSTGT